MATDPSQKHRKLRALNKVLNIYTLFGVVLWILATVFILVPSFPYIWYRINNDATGDEVETIVTPTEEDADSDSSFADIIEKYQEDEDEVDLPEFDESLSNTNTLIISKIGVNGEIHEGTNAKATLEEGIWRVNDFGTPEDKTSIILAAHRFGYIYWSNDFRRTQSFFNLPKTGVGDHIEIVWNQRKYEYEIYRAEDSTVIQDYDADLILYTCRMFNSPVRVFRYARRVN